MYIVIISSYHTVMLFDILLKQYLLEKAQMSSSEWFIVIRDAGKRKQLSSPIQTINNQTWTPIDQCAVAMVMQQVTYPSITPDSNYICVQWACKTAHTSHLKGLSTNMTFCGRKMFLLWRKILYFTFTFFSHRKPFLCCNVVECTCKRSLSYVYWFRDCKNEPHANSF